MANFTKFISIPDANPDSFGRKALNFINAFGSKLPFSSAMRKRNPEVLRLKSTSGRGSDTEWILNARSSQGWIRN